MGPQGRWVVGSGEAFGLGSELEKGGGEEGGGIEVQEDLGEERRELT